MVSIGQWFGKTSGTNTGLAVLNLEFLNPLAGRIMFADDDLKNPALSAAIKFNSLGKTVEAELFDFEYFNYATLQFEHSRVVNLRPDVKLATKGIISGVLKENRITGSWSTDSDTNGEFSLEKSVVDKMRKPDSKIGSWDKFKKYVSSLVDKRDGYIYRGQKDLKWNLCSSFFRNGRNDLLRYARSDVPALAQNINATSTFKYDLNKNDEFGALLNLSQHHGYPTPLLDWTESPYVAAFFAYENVSKLTKRGSVRIYIFNHLEWMRKTYQSRSIIDPRPTLTVSILPAINNNRAIPQQSVYTFSNMEDIQGFINYYEGLFNTKFLTVIELPVKERNKAMDDLRCMGITAGALFPGFDGICKALKERYFMPIRD